jgi:hypothetical protein
VCRLVGAKWLWHKGIGGLEWNQEVQVLVEDLEKQVG